MGTPNDVLRIAAGEIGYYAPDDPQPGSKYGRWMADVTGESWLAGPSTEVWWCMIFVSWVFAQAGVDFPGAPSYNTDSTLAAARKVGRVTDAGHAGPGDIVVFDWNFSSAATDHVGIVEKNYGTYLQTIEGNTSGSAAGKQSNGNGVWRRTRDYSVVAGVVSPYWDGPSSAAPVHASLDVDGWWGPATVRALQAALGTEQDGVVSNQDSRDMSAIGGVPSTACHGEGLAGCSRHRAGRRAVPPVRVREGNAKKVELEHVLMYNVIAPLGKLVSRFCGARPEKMHRSNGERPALYLPYR